MRTALRTYLRHIRVYRMIKRSGIFDRDYYLRNNLDVARECMDPIKHYIRYGWREGRNPSDSFNTGRYLSKYPQIVQENINPLYHYLKNSPAEEARAGSNLPNSPPVSLSSSMDGISGSRKLARWRLMLSLLWMGLRQHKITWKLFSPQRLKLAALTLAGKHDEPGRLLHRYRTLYEKNTDSALLLEKARAAAASRGDLFIFPIIDWHFRIQRPQHLALHLARRGYRVFYFSTMPLLREGNHRFEITEQIQERVFLCQLRSHGSPQNIYKDTMDTSVLRAYRESILDLMNKVRSNAAVSIIHLPYWKPLAESIPGVLYGYDCMDHHAGFSSDSSEIPPREVHTLRDADFVITTSAYLQKNCKQVRDAILIRNGTEHKRIAEYPARPRSRNRAKAVGYIGAVAEWFDTDLIMKAARRYPQWQFVLAGGTVGCDLSEMKKIPNIRCLGEIPYEAVPQCLHAFDVAVIPFRIVELTKATNPVKVYEYLSAGKPVVATAIPELYLFEKLIHIGTDHEDFLNKLATAMEESGDADKAAARSNWAKGQDWSVRARDFDQFIRESHPKVSIVVLTHNQLQFTQACLQGIEKNTAYPNYEVLIVDNGSSDGTVAFLREYVSERMNYRLICNPENRGFAAGNNIGIRRASGDYVVLLNNDTYPAPGWLGNLVYPLIRNPRIGLAGPVTNNIGNEARIEIAYRNMSEMAEQAALYTQAHRGKRLLLHNIAFFCAAIARRVITKIGLLDEGFTMGFFEDDDYCRRARAAGFQIVVAEDSFVHHHLSASFNLLGEQKEKIFQGNKRLYEEKWGPWQPHKSRISVE